jgi:hypothetical protein
MKNSLNRLTLMERQSWVRTTQIEGSHVAFRGFLPRKTTPGDLDEITIIAKPL